MARSKTSCLFPFFLVNDFLLLLFDVSYKCTNIVTIIYLCLTINLGFGLPSEIGTKQCTIFKKKKKTDRSPLLIFFPRESNATMIVKSGHPLTANGIYKV